MHGFINNIEKLTLENSNFRTVIYTAKNMQLVLMSLEPNQEIGLEVHDTSDQFFRFESGEGKVVIDGVETTIKDGSAVIIPCGAKHNIINTSPDKPLKCYTIYAGPHHKDKTIHATKQIAEASEEEFDGVTTE